MLCLQHRKSLLQINIAYKEHLLPHCLPPCFSFRQNHFCLFLPEAEIVRTKSTAHVVTSFVNTREKGILSAVTERVIHLHTHAYSCLSKRDSDKAAVTEGDELPPLAHPRPLVGLPESSSHLHYTKLKRCTIDRREKCGLLRSLSKRQAQSNSYSWP